MSKNERIRPMSHFQFGTLNWLNGVELETLRGVHAGTLTSILRAGWAKRDGSKVVRTKAGQEALDRYRHARVNVRLHEAELTERCQRLLGLIRARRAQEE